MRKWFHCVFKRFTIPPGPSNLVWGHLQRLPLKPKVNDLWSVWSWSVAVSKKFQSSKTRYLVLIIYNWFMNDIFQTPFVVTHKMRLRKTVAINNTVDLIAADDGKQLFLSSRSKNQFFDKRELLLDFALCQPLFPRFMPCAIYPKLVLRGSFWPLRFSFGSGEWRDGPATWSNILKSPLMSRESNEELRCQGRQWIDARQFLHPMVQLRGYWIHMHHPGEKRASWPPSEYGQSWHSRQPCQSDHGHGRSWWSRFPAMQWHLTCLKTILQHKILYNISSTNCISHIILGAGFAFRYYVCSPQVKVEVSHHARNGETGWQSTKCLVFVLDDPPEKKVKEEKETKKGKKKKKEPALNLKNYGSVLDIGKVKSASTTMVLAWRCRFPNKAPKTSFLFVPQALTLDATSKRAILIVWYVMVYCM